MKLNILHITPDFNYACGRSYYVYLLAKYLSRKHNVTVITNGGDSLERLEEKGIGYTLLKGLKSKNPISIAGNISALKRVIAENSINVVHTHHRLTEVLALQAIKRIKKNKPVSVFTSLSIVKRKYNIEYRSDGIIAVSNSVKEMLLRRFSLDKDRIKLIHNFTDTEEIHELEIIAPRSRDHGKFFIILAIGRFHNDKDFETLLKALNLLKKEKIGLILVGEGNNDIDYRRYIARNDLNVEIIVPQKNLLQYFLIADICVLPSTRDPFPNFMLQAGLHRVPFIGANVDGIGELIEDGGNGLLFKAGNEKELAEKILFFRDNKKLAEECAVKLHEDVLNNYTQEFVLPKIEHLYRTLLRH
ncbi:MAG TPA: glycosyltransferase family 4 protein [Ignavibacteria bacterium]|nr:glycosyltransferase family 4 protein [Ignavibacteria bacterium]HRF67229.1 glycosyltransferase family 4 protein [Ignavibacteria bacterium]HRJ04867.1 glycosyltransferase family 4 protein [Ignavibacteria bacterium]